MIKGYIIIISLISIFLTVYDKIAAKRFPRNRVPEKILLGTAFLGGAAAEYITMQTIRHKTRHKKFMLSLPLFTVIHIIIILSIIYLE